jgi:hypothetical protein
MGGHVERMAQTRNTYKILLGKLKVSKCLGLYGRIILIKIMMIMPKG